MMTSTTQAVLEPTRLVHARVSWGAVFAGLLLALMTYLFLGVVGTAIGASAMDPLQDRNPLSGFGTGAGLWVGVSTLIALAVGSFIAGRSAPTHGMLHGVLTWAMTTLVTVYAVSALAGGIIGTATRVAGSGVALAGQGVAAAAPSIASGVKDQLQKNGVDFDFSDARDQLLALLRQSGKSELDPSKIGAAAGQTAQDAKSAASNAAATPQNSSSDIDGFFDRLRQRAQPILNAADKEALINIVMARTGKSRPEAEQIVANYQQTYDQAVAKYQQLKAQAEQSAREAGDAAAKGVSKAAWSAVVVLLLGLVISAGAGTFGRRVALRDPAIAIA